MTNASSDTTACAEQAGKVAPVINRSRCEGKADCVAVCPYAVFEVRQFTWEELGDISLRGRLKAWAHKRMQADVVFVPEVLPRRRHHLGKIFTVVQPSARRKKTC